MTKKSETIVFFGSGPVAAESLRLLAQDFTIEAVITKPRAEHHKGPVPVLDIAAGLNLPVHTVSNRKELDTLFETKPVSSRIAVLIDFGIIVSQQVIDFFPLGILNSHFSLLPEWRGADPITFSILSGQKTSGVSLMLLTAGMDEGPILAYTTRDLNSEITTPVLTDLLIEDSYHQLVAILPMYIHGDITALPQDATDATYSRKLTKADSILDWNKSADTLEREIRAFIEWPKSKAKLGDIDIVITKAHVMYESGAPGTIGIRDKLLFVYCGQNALAIERLKPAGKKEMTGEAFLAGYKSTLLRNLGG
jgi:methionyl-tRNA formyltransferase